MASHEDAMLLVQLFRWGTQLGIENASKAVLSESFDPKSASVNGCGTRCRFLATS